MSGWFWTVASSAPNPIVAKSPEVEEEGKKKKDRRPRRSKEERKGTPSSKTLRGDRRPLPESGARAAPRAQTGESRSSGIDGHANPVQPSLPEDTQRRGAATLQRSLSDCSVSSVRDLSESDALDSWRPSRGRSPAAEAAAKTQRSPVKKNSHSQNHTPSHVQSHALSSNSNPEISPSNGSGGGSGGLANGIGSLPGGNGNGNGGGSGKHSRQKTMAPTGDSTGSTMATSTLPLDGSGDGRGRSGVRRVRPKATASSSHSPGPTASGVQGRGRGPSVTVEMADEAQQGGESAEHGPSAVESHDESSKFHPHPTSEADKKSAGGEGGAELAKAGGGATLRVVTQLSDSDLARSSGSVELIPNFAASSGAGGVPTPVGRLSRRSKQRLMGGRGSLGRMSPGLARRVSDLDEWMPHRPTWQRVLERKMGVDAGGVGSGQSSAEILQQLFAREPDWMDVLDNRMATSDRFEDEEQLAKRAALKSQVLQLVQEKPAEMDRVSDLLDCYYEAALSSAADETSGSSEASFHEEAARRFAGDVVDFFDLDVVAQVGTGAYSNVYCAFLKGYSQDRKVAVKILKPKLGDPFKALNREIDALKRTLGSPYTVQLIGYCIHPHICVVTEYCLGNSLEYLIHKAGMKFSVEQAVRVLKQVAEAMRYLHGFRPPIIHRDLTSGNVFFQRSHKEGRVVVGDFGISVVPQGKAPWRLSRNGAPRYRAPEVTRGLAYTRKVDVYSFGNLCYEVLTGNRPFHFTDEAGAAELIAQGKTCRFRGEVHADRRFFRLIRRCWAETPKDRPSFKRIVAILERVELEHTDVAYYAANLGERPGPPVTATAAPLDSEAASRRVPFGLGSSVLGGSAPMLPFASPSVPSSSNAFPLSTTSSVIHHPLNSSNPSTK